MTVSYSVFSAGGGQPRPGAALLRGDHGPGRTPARLLPRPRPRPPAAAALPRPARPPAARQRPWRTVPAVPGLRAAAGLAAAGAPDPRTRRPHAAGTGGDLPPRARRGLPGSAAAALPPAPRPVPGAGPRPRPPPCPDQPRPARQHSTPPPPAAAAGARHQPRPPATALPQQRWQQQQQQWWQQSRPRRGRWRRRRRAAVARRPRPRPAGCPAPRSGRGAAAAGRGKHPEPAGGHSCSCGRAGRLQLPRLPAERAGDALQPRPPPRARRQRCQRGRELRGSALLGRETGRGEAQGSSQVRYRAASILQVI